MSDTYQALLDCSADRHDARRLAPTVANVLASHELINEMDAWFSVSEDQPHIR